jgi:transposase
LVRRGLALLFLDQGEPVTRVAGRLAINRRNLYKWARRFEAGGLPALNDKARPGRKRAIAAEVPAMPTPPLG